MDPPVTQKSFRVDESSQFAAWQNAVCRDYVFIECETKQGSPFRGSMMQSYVGPLQISTVESEPIQYRRSAQSIRQDPRAALQLTCLLDGSFIVEQFGRAVSLAPGDMTLYAASAPFVLDCPKAYSA